MNLLMVRMSSRLNSVNYENTVMTNKLGIKLDVTLKLFSEIWVKEFYLSIVHSEVRNKISLLMLIRIIT